MSRILPYNRQEDTSKSDLRVILVIDELLLSSAAVRQNRLFIHLFMGLNNCEID